MRIPRLYFDTSVFGGIFDIEFQKETDLLFEMVKNGEIICVYSDLCEFELENVPEKVNVFRIRGYNSINIKNGYIPLDIRSPKDIITNGN